jgi:hypothetical protein
MKKIIFGLSLLGTMALLISCGGAKGDPETIKVWEEIVAKGCACATTDCLYEIKVQDKSIVTWIKETKTDNMTEEEKTKYYSLYQQYGDCERKLSGK